MTVTQDYISAASFPVNLSPQEIDARCQELLAQLTLDEKIAIMCGDPSFWSGMVDMMGGGYADHPWHAGAIPRLGIPGIRFVDGPRGIVLDGATTFPAAMARGAAWDPDLEERIGDVIGTELRALGGNLFGGVCINLLRHPAWGRAQETYGEDPYHLGEMGAALARGVQQHAMACVKHYALNSMENARFKVDVTISPRALHEIYLAHFKRVVDEGVASVMSSYNSCNGEWCGQNKTLLTDILKDQWGFQGFVLTDFIFGMRDAQKAALAGQDLEMPFQMHYNQHLKSLVETDRVPVERLDDAVLRLLRAQFKYVKPGSYHPAMVSSPEHRTLARQAAQKSIVLLQNEGDLLPLQGIKKLAVIGHLANTPNTGDGGSSCTRPAYVVTPLQGIQAALQDQAEVLYHDGRDLESAQRIAQSADVVVVVVGYTHEDEGEFIGPDMITQFAPTFPPPTPEEEPIVQGFLQTASQQVGTFPPGGDRDSLALKPHDEDLIRALASANPRIIVAIMSGSAVIVESWSRLAPAILMLWYPGMEGGHALADILLGRVNPGGKLPFAVPSQAAHLPFFDKDATHIEYDLWHGYRKLERDQHTPAFPFGFGLSYTTFHYANLALSQHQLDPHDTLHLSLDLTNIGTRSGDEIVQLYVSALDSRVERAPKELKAFTRLNLPAGQTTTVHLDLPISRLAFYDPSQAAFVVEPLEYQVFVGSHSLDPQALTACFTVSGDPTLT